MRCSRKWWACCFAVRASGGTPSLTQAYSQRVPRNHWHRKENVLQALESVELKLGIQKPEDWYSVTLADLKELGFPWKMGKMKLVQLLGERYPGYKWETYLLRGKFAQQKRLERAISSLFNGQEMRITARKEAQLLPQEAGDYLELDIYIPALNLAFEYQDIHHYASSDYAYQTLEDYQARDRLKQQSAAAKGITLIQIPCWWDGKQESLVATIRHTRPDLLQDASVENVAPIPETMPHNFRSALPTQEIADIGEPMLACFLTQKSADPTNWWMFEKYDGVRGFWNPLKKKFYSRRGRELVLPQYIVDTMPSDMFLDGEFWFGHNNFQEAAKLANRAAPVDIDWGKFKYMVFDKPKHSGNFSQRYQELVTRFSALHSPYIEVAGKEVCTDTQHFERFFQDIIDRGGEGVILRDPDAPFRHGRSPGYLKHKKYRDSEARVVQSFGPHQWECELPNGILFTAAAGTTEFARRWSPQKGDIVTFKHHGFLQASKRPKFPTIYRIRNDLSWEDVVSNWNDQSQSSANLPSSIRRSSSASSKSKHEKGFWNEPANHKLAFDALATQLGITKPSDWYSVSRKDVVRLGGGGLLAHYGSLGQILKTFRPESSWELSKFKEAGRHPHGFWNKRDNLLKALSAAEKKLAITKAEDWYTVTLADLTELGLPSSLNKQKLVSLLEEKYPDHKWDKLYFLKGKYAQQMRLERTVNTLFSGLDISRNVRKDTALLNPATGEYLELDIFIPSLQLAFEYQEKHHYTSSPSVFQPLQTYQTRDRIKRELVREKGITLITVPFWWDGSQQSLVASIKKLRPELLPAIDVDTTMAIPEEMPPQSVDKHVQHIEDIGEPITACFLTQMNTDPTNWWLFEKYDGVRAFWHPGKKTFYSRYGKPFMLPQNIIDAMPSDVFLDGELWFGRDSFEEAMKIANRVDFSLIDWKHFRYVVFDLPKHQGAYQERYNELVNRYGSDIEGPIMVAEKQLCEGISHMERKFQEIIDGGGEGVILRDPASPMRPGRSAGFLKHKKYRDSEAKIVNIIGENVYECELPNGIRFTAGPGTFEFATKWSPMVGDIVTFKHRGFLHTSKKPKLPALYRVRRELTWEDVKQQFEEPKAALQESPFQYPRTQKKHKGYWRDVENRKKFFIDLATQLGFDPFEWANWRSITPTQAKSKKGGGSVIAHYNGNLERALKDTFPELQNMKFAALHKTKYHWKDINNCRAFFDEFAALKGFDPVHLANWDTVPLSEITAQPDGRSVARYRGGIRAALRNAYPTPGTMSAAAQ